MNAPGSTLATTSFGLVLVIIMCYVAGRIHQWYRHTTDRESAFREGYNLATQSLFSLATRTTSMERAIAPPVTVVRGVAVAAPAIVVSGNVTAIPGRSARHRAEEPSIGETRQMIAPGDTERLTA